MDAIKRTINSYIESVYTQNPVSEKLYFLYIIFRVPVYNFLTFVFFTIQSIKNNFTINLSVIGI